MRTLESPDSLPADIDQGLTARPAAHLASVHGLRGVAAFGVMFLHLHEHLPQLGLATATALFSKLYLAVDLFFILSGIVLAHVYDQRFRSHVSRDGYADFFMARIARIMPMLLMASVVALAADRLLATAGLADQAWSTALAAFVVEAFGGSAWFEWVWLNPPSWSLSAEFALYLVAPWLIVATRQLPNAWLWLLLVAAPAIPGVCYPLLTRFFEDPSGWTALPGTGWGLLGPEAPWFWIVKGPFVMSRALPMFLCGLCLHRLAQRGALEPLASPWVMAAAFGLTLGIMHEGLPRIVVLVAMVLLAATCLGTRTLGHPVLRGRFLFWLGNISLGLYLLHYPIIEATRALWQLAKDQPLLLASQREGWLLLISMVVITLIIADLGYRWLEHPARRAIREAWRRHRKMREAAAPRTIGRWSAAALVGLAGLAAVAVIPWGIFTQTWLVRPPARPGEAAILVDAVAREAAPNRLSATLVPRLPAAGETPLPLTVAADNGWVARFGSHRRNSMVAAADQPVTVYLDRSPLLPASSKPIDLRVYVAGISHRVELSVADPAP